MVQKRKREGAVELLCPGGTVVFRGHGSFVDKETGEKKIVKPGVSIKGYSKLPVSIPASVIRAIYESKDDKDVQKYLSEAEKEEAK